MATDRRRAPSGARAAVAPCHHRPRRV